MNNTIHGITVDYSRDNLFDELGLKRLREPCMREEVCRIVHQEIIAELSNGTKRTP